jgi:glyoxylase-like metal-dependent hydrolase (beta-lactamase superfamily II)
MPLPTQYTLDDAPWILRFPVRTPTLPPATHTNVYIVGEREVAVIDAASPWPEEQRALDQFITELEGLDGRRVRELLLTHHHLDHVSGTAHLAARLGVPVAAHPETARLVAGRIAVARLLADGEVLPYGPDGLRALHTPGHAPGHLVFVDERSRSVVAGDMVASVGTIIIDPPEGDMRLYLDSLARLRALGARRLLPAHGEPVDDPERLLSFYVAHRLEREARVLAALRAGAAPVEELVPRAYPEVAPALYALAARSLLAHLLKLRDEGRALESAGVWSAS